MSMKTFEKYTVKLSTEPSYYGSICTQSDADRIVESLAEMIRGMFPGINVEKWEDGNGSSASTGPDDQTVEEIDRWIADNWTSAL